MSLTLHTLAPRSGSRQKKFRIGRGLGSGRGKTAGRGTKGQRARTGGRKRLRLKGLKQMLLGFPKLRGFQSRYAKPVVLRLNQLEKFEAGTTLDLKALKRAGLVRRNTRSVKVVGEGELNKKIQLVGILTTASAKVAILKAGGKVSPLKEKSAPKKTKK